MYSLLLAALVIFLGSAGCAKPPAEKRTQCTFEGFEPRGKSEVTIYRLGHTGTYLQITPDAQGRVTFVLPKGADCEDFAAVSDTVQGRLVP